MDRNPFEPADQEALPSLQSGVTSVLLAVLAPLKEEIAGVLMKGQFHRVLPDVWIGNLAGLNCVAAIVGIGKVHSTCQTQYVIDRFQPAVILHLGTAGATSSDLSIGDLVLATKVAQHDLYLSDDTRHRLDHPIWIELPRNLIEFAISVMRNESRLSVRPGTIVTGDRPIMSDTERESLRSRFGADCADMESAAVAYVCAQRGIPCLIARSISDRCDANTPSEFRSSIPRIADGLGLFATCICAGLQQKELPLQSG